MTPQSTARTERRHRGPSPDIRTGTGTRALAASRIKLRRNFEFRASASATQHVQETAPISRCPSTLLLTGGDRGARRKRESVSCRPDCILRKRAGGPTIVDNVSPDQIRPSPGCPQQHKNAHHLAARVGSRRSHLVSIRRPCTCLARRGRRCPSWDSSLHFRSRECAAFRSSPMPIDLQFTRSHSFQPATAELRNSHSLSIVGADVSHANVNIADLNQHRVKYIDCYLFRGNTTHG